MNKFLLATGVVAAVTLQGCSEEAPDDTKLATDAAAELKRLQDEADKTFKRAAKTADGMTHFCNKDEADAKDDQKKGYTAWLEEEIEKISKDDKKKAMLPFIGQNSFAEFACNAESLSTKAQRDQFAKVMKGEGEKKLKLEAEAKKAEKKDDDKTKTDDKTKADNKTKTDNKSALRLN
jgi:hypothetical protein